MDIVIGAIAAIAVFCGVGWVIERMFVGDDTSSRHEPSLNAFQQPLRDD